MDWKSRETLPFIAFLASVRVPASLARTENRSAFCFFSLCTTHLFVNMIYFTNIVTCVFVCSNINSVIVITASDLTGDGLASRSKGMRHLTKSPEARRLPKGVWMITLREQIYMVAVAGPLAWRRGSAQMHNTDSLSPERCKNIVETNCMTCQCLHCMPS
ncbi:hypothetical protein B0T26DRAFT_282088 [Lasiosphaeria miniovina]|uniref:Uncharacterized protein n=1 Tax=Lasiosphaeria miniovina TaxID=1954250 RepID=A0AA40AJP5_9PEZI|nr:uncharacterized protein B0T26DRAFT_282088 [Lasiosphaeria miniovina]KAK0717131.1 hypothetical protein B0T26DRAFT_282088 [Lasiosphaeria miniovina]